jgi:hypothetical protein
VVESNNQVQHQRDYLPALDISINKAKQQTNTLHIGTHINFSLNMPCWIPILKWIIAHINIQIQAINRPC